MGPSRWAQNVFLIALTISVLTLSQLVIDSVRPTDHGRPPIAKEQPGPGQHESVPTANKEPSAIALTRGALPGKPLYVESTCDENDSAAECNKRWWQRLWTDPIAVFTFALMVFTGLLVLVSNRQVNLARQEFISTHRPKIIVRAFEMGNPQLPDEETIFVMFVAQNIGDSPAHIEEIRTRIFILPNGTEIPSNAVLQNSIPIEITLQGGERELFPSDDGTVPLPGQGVQIFATTMNLYCVGIVRYADDMGAIRETGFCRQWHFRANRWETITSSEYEYAY